ncbi:CinA family protein [Microbacterium cremeum]|uniref:CinA family protein n=1 Tax=Microbacterium cremeum TaxID=2782169 RepID=UPI001887F006|nr:CinA family protein [Microbacterium cremeum]
MTALPDPAPAAQRSVEDSLELIGTHARRRGIRIALAESLTSGALASRVGAGERASDWFAGGVVAYQMRTKRDVLGVPEGIDPCSAECAELLAIGVRRLLGADIAVSATGVGGPDPEDGHEPGTVYLGWSSDGSTGHRLLQLDGEPEKVLDATVNAAIDLLVDIVSSAPRREAG